MQGILVDLNSLIIFTVYIAELWARFGIWRKTVFDKL